MDILCATGARAPLGIILYDGPSKIDGKPIVVIATGFRRRTSNGKTGDMIQTWIIRSDIPPIVAINTGDDSSVCGRCPLRGLLERSSDGTTKNRYRSCYVSVRNAPRAIYEAYRRNRYVPYDAGKHRKLFRNRMLRLGSYGDPVAVPYSIWSPLIRLASGHTGYSHQWRDPKHWRFRRIVMASVETPELARLAWSKGWRTFRTAHNGAMPDPEEFRCPASSEAGKRLTCETCGACNGAGDNHRRASVLIQVHGSPAVILSYGRLGGRHETAV